MSDEQPKQVILKCKCEYGDENGVCRMYPDTPHKCIVLFGLYCDDADPPNWWDDTQPKMSRDEVKQRIREIVGDEAFGKRGDS